MAITPQAVIARLKEKPIFFLPFVVVAMAMNTTLNDYMKKDVPVDANKPKETLLSMDDGAF